MSALSDSDKRRYDRDGIVFPIRALSHEEALDYRGACDDLERQLGGKPRTIDVRQMHLHFPWAAALCAHPGILDAVEDLLGPDVLVWATELFAKHPHDATMSIGWHRDRVYMGFDARMVTTAWVSLGDSTRGNGCMRAVPRSVPSHAETGRRVVVDESTTIDVVLQPGEMSLHDDEILHGSGPNCSAAKRVGFAIRYVRPDATPPDGRPAALLVRGRDVHGHFQIVEPPTDNDSEEALAAMKNSAALHLESILLNLRRRRS